MKKLIRNYKMSDPELVLKCEDVLDSMDRDIAEFNLRGLTPAKRDAFEADIASFDALPTDNYLLGQQEIKTGEKNTTRGLAETKITVALVAVVNVWGLDSTQYGLFTENKAMSQMTDAEMFRYIEDVADAAEDNLTPLADQGIDATYVTDLRALRTEFNNKLKAQRIATKARNTGEGVRVKAGNALYKLLVGFCNTGKNIWLNVDETKYNDYVITENPGSDLDDYNIERYPIPPGGSLFAPMPDGPLNPATLLYIRPKEGSVFICGTDIPASPCSAGYEALQGITFKGALSELGLDLTKTHVQITNPGLTMAIVRIGVKDVE